MNEELSFGERVRRELFPTAGQALLAMVVALIVLAISQSTTLMAKLNITSAGVEVSRHSLGDQLHGLVVSPLAANVALITFWATVGLIAYLVCWAFYNSLIEARNEVTLETGYTNRGHWHWPWQTLGLKLLCGAILVGILASLHVMGPFWVDTAHPLFYHVAFDTVFWAIVGVVGLAANLYLVLAFVQLTFTPWYRVKVFT